jgi:hypothetical protein
MADDPGLTIPTDSYPTLVRNMQRLSHLPINGLTARTRKAARFPPGPGSRLYQCVFGPRLTRGTPRYPDDGERLEPVCICVIIGSTTDTGIEQLSNRALFKINDAIDKAALCDQAGILNKLLWEDFRNDKDVSDFDETVGSATGFELLRLRFCSGSVFPGVIISGNERDGWNSNGPSVLTLEIDDKVVDDDEEANLYSAKIIVNQAAVDAGKAEESQLVEELVMVRCDRHAGRGDLCQGIKIQATVNPQMWLSNDTAYGENGEFWYKPENARWYPVLDCVSRDGYAFNNDSGNTIPAYGCFRVTGTTVIGTANVLSGNTQNSFGAQFSHYINGPEEVSSVGLCYREGVVPVLWDVQDGTPVAGETWGPKENSQQDAWALRKNVGGFIVRGVLDQDNYVMLVSPQPFLRFTGVANADIAADALGTVSVYYRNASGSTPFTTDTNYDMTNVLNGLDVTVASGSKVEVEWDQKSDGTVGWRIKQAHYTCP